MKVLLINPPTPQKDIRIREGRCQDIDKWSAPFSPLSLAYIASQVDKLAESQLIDSGPQGYDLEQVLNEISRFKPDLVIFTSSTPTAQFDFEWFLPRVKNKFSEIKMATTGVHASVLAKEIMTQCQDLDFIICGEPEITAYQLTKAIRDNLDYGDILGLAFRDEQGEVIINPARPFVENLDDLGIPAWHKVDFSKYLMPIKNRPFSLICFSRGCPFNCSFCVLHAYYGHKLRKRSPQQIIEEIKLLNSLGVYDFLFWTEFLTADKDYLDKFLDFIFEEKLDKKINWVTNIRTDYADYKTLEKMKKAGCWQVVFGIEFGTDEMLERVNKGGRASVVTSQQAVQSAVEAGLVADGHFILGYPGETLAQIEKTIDLAMSLPLTFAHFYPASPFPGSQLYQEALEKNLFESQDWSKITLGTASIKTPEFDTEKINGLMNKAYRKFYGRPQVWLRIMKIPRSLKEYKSLFVLGIKFLGGLII